MITKAILMMQIEFLAAIIRKASLKGKDIEQCLKGGKSMSWTIKIGLCIVISLQYSNANSKRVDISITVISDKPVQIDKVGNQYEIDQTYRFLITHRITNPDYFIAANELGRNTF